MNLRLPAGLTALIATLAFAVAVEFRATATALDEPLPAVGARIMNPEFSANGDFVAWLEIDTSQGVPGNYAYRLWVDTLDPSTGWPSHGGARGLFVPAPELGAFNLRSMPQWGLNDATAHPELDQPCGLWQGDFLVWFAEGESGTETEAGIVRARFHRSLSGSNPRLCREGAIILPEDTSGPNQTANKRRKRAFPFAAKNPASPRQLISYQLRDGGINPPFGNFKLMALDARDASVSHRHRVVSNEALSYPTGIIAAGIINSAPWLRGSSTVYFGQYDGCNPFVDPCPAQVARWNFERGGVARAVTADGVGKLDMVPIVLNGLPSFTAGLENTRNGALYLTDPGDSSKLVQASELAWDPAQSTLVDGNGDGEIEPFFAQSFETFEWGGDTYTVFQVSEDAAMAGGLPRSPFAFTYQTEIWLARLRFDDAPIVCKISRDDLPGLPMVRHEPETVVINDHAYVYYSIGTPGETEMDEFEWYLRRIDLGELADKTRFDTACANGEAAQSAPGAG